MCCYTIPNHIYLNRHESSNKILYYHYIQIDSQLLCVDLLVGHKIKDHIYIRIEDTGCGISEENMEKLFDPFFSTKGHKGTGLGLSVSYGIIQSHGGDIEVESKPGKGTAFTITLPI